MTEPMQDPPEAPDKGLPVRMLRFVGRFLTAIAGHLLMYVLIGLVIGIGLWLLGGLSLPQALIAGLAVVVLLIMLGAAGA